jgi:hypothetical protein
LDPAVAVSFPRLAGARVGFCTLLTFVSGGGRAWSMTPLLSQLRVKQKIEKDNHLSEQR